uniref:Uncharacterized protein n=1 Tax=Helianthus annuus TaxID=4232 RepID=A0A251TDZ1_HELAN
MSSPSPEANDSKMLSTEEVMMPWVGLYVAVASLICIIAMAADVRRLDITDTEKDRECKQLMGGLNAVYLK